jgi:hypothetical protein
VKEGTEEWLEVRIGLVLRVCLRFDVEVVEIDLPTPSKILRS